ncbi:hypothetical protein [Pseudaminobacter soli (ex Li et al. 2025)]|uniref:hypothetical protein n=1 Tax=Pseudaminobacter soli (ex Li et al. 2025) TaxID=1295366 RepID=UPI0011B1CB16|nr:hypothetical protein [Mesorhizobium soli]
MTQITIASDPKQPVPCPTPDLMPDGRIRPNENAELLRRKKSDCDGTLRRIRELVERNRLL